MKKTVIKVGVALLLTLVYYTFFESYLCIAVVLECSADQKIFDPFFTCQSCVPLDYNPFPAYAHHILTGMLIPFVLSYLLLEVLFHIFSRSR